MLEQLRIGKYLLSKDVNGPGERFVIWLQGCTFKCNGCYNPEFWDLNGGYLMNIDEIFELIMRTKGIEGVTFTGGEPLLQAKALVKLAQKIKTQGLSILCYTGFSYEQILAGEVDGASELLQWIDILIDGLYKEEEKAALIWRGSRNQNVYFLSDTYLHLKSIILSEGTKQVELHIDKDGVTITGFYENEFWKKFQENIR